MQRGTRRSLLSVAPWSVACSRDRSTPDGTRDGTSAAPAAAATAVPSSAGSTLHYVATGGNGERFYVDTATLRASGDSRAFNLVAVETAPKQSLGATYDESTTMDSVACSARRFTLGTFTGYYKGRQQFSNPGTSDIPIRPHSAFDSVLTFVCSRGK